MSQERQWVVLDPSNGTSAENPQGLPQDMPPGGVEDIKADAQALPNGIEPDKDRPAE